MTAAYLQRLSGTPADNNCQFEFEHALGSLTSTKMIPIGFEPSCATPNMWAKGTVRTRLGKRLSFNLSEAGPRFESELKHLVQEIRRIGNFVGTSDPGKEAGEAADVPGKYLSFSRESLPLLSRS